MRLGALSVVTGILWAVSGEECIEQQTYDFDNIFNQHYYYLFTNGCQIHVHNFLILLFFKYEIALLRPKDDYFSCIMLKTIQNLSRQYLHTGLLLSERFGSFV